MKSSAAAQRLSFALDLSLLWFLTFSPCMSEGETTQRTKDGNAQKLTNSDG